jgi:hypothetical protein
VVDALGSVVDERQQRVKTEASLERRASLLLLAVRGHQRRVHVDDQRARGVAPASGARLPASAHTRARAVLIAARDRGASTASASMMRDTVGSEATRP